MFSNTANNSASDKVKTRPKWKAYLSFIANLKNHQREAALIIGYFFVALLFFNVGKFFVIQNPPAIKIQEPSLDLSQIYDTLKNQPLQQIAGETKRVTCEGKIKGNPSSKIYHVPGGAFYDRLTDAVCFDTEEEAQAAGFRKSQH